MNQRANKNGWNSPGFRAALIILLTLVTYLPALHNGFIWDDDDHFTKNPAMLATDGLKQIWSSLPVSRYYPLTLTTFWVERRCWGLQPLPYHAVNIVLQVINALLVWTLLRRLRVRGAWVAAAVWAIHPVNVETVAWVTELKNTQSGFFFFLALLFFLRFEDELRSRDYWLAMVCGMAAMLSKPSTVVLPVLILLCLWWRRGGWTRRDWLRVAPLAALAGGTSLLTIVEQHGQIKITGAADWTLTSAQRLMLAGNAVWFYAGKLIWPANFCFIYPRWELPVHSLLAWLPLAGLVAAAGALWRFRKTDAGRIALFGVAWFVIALLPVLGFFDIFFFRYSYVADHFQYLAGLGFVVGVVGLGNLMIDRAPAWGRRLGMLGVASVLLFLGLSSRKLLPLYQNDETLWRATLARNPQSGLAYNNLGFALLRAGKTQEAISHYEQAVLLQPNDFTVHDDLGIALAQVGRLPEAIEQYEQTLRIKPNDAEAHYNLGVALAQVGQTQAAIRHYEEALRLRPDFAEAHFNLGKALELVGQTQAVINQYEQTLRLRPDFADAHNNLGIALFQVGQTQAAIGHFEQALRIRPDYAEAHYNLGTALAQAGQTQAATKHFEEALRLNPNFVEARAALKRAQSPATDPRKQNQP